MSIIYEPRGKALEYSPLAANLYRGCSHGCAYCYAPSATFKDRSIFHSAEFIQPRANVLKEFKKDCEQFSGDPRECLLSFTTDPYQPIEAELKLTRSAISLCRLYDIYIVILTKGGKLATRDFDILSKCKRKKFGVTLTTDNDNVSLRWEPFADLPAERIKALLEAWTLGIETFVSFEPVIDVEAVFRLIDKTYEFVDFYKFGKLNHHNFEKTIDWVSFRERVIEKLESLNKKYMIKKDLLNA
jgi:DNA repair photolyase